MTDLQDLTFSSESEDFAQYMADTEPSVKVHQASAWRDALRAEGEHGRRITGATLPWAGTHENIRCRSGEVSVWAGINGSGKSQLLGQVVTALMAQGEKACIASFEMSPLRTLSRMQRQAAMCASPSGKFTDKFMDWLEGKLWIYDQKGQVDPKMLYAVIRYAAQRLGVKHFVVDSMMKCVRGEDDYNGQKNFVDMLIVLAGEHDIHIHLVHHVKKGERDDKPPTKWDVKGSGSITDQVDQLFIVWRNKPKEVAIETARAKGQMIDDDLTKRPDTVLCVEKNRNGEWEGRIPLWFHRESLQYTPDSRCRPLHLMEN